MKLSVLNKGLLFTAALGLFASSAFATEELKLTTGGSTITIIDNLAGDSNASVGEIVYSNTNLNGWNITVVAGVSNSPGTNPALDLDVLLNCATASCVGSTATNQLEAVLSDTGYTTKGGGVLIFPPNLSGGASASVKAYVDSTNTIFGEPAGGLVASCTTTCTQSGGPSVGPGAYSATIDEILTASSTGGVGQFSIDTKLNVVPEPGSIMLLGTALSGMALLLRRKRAKS